MADATPPSEFADSLLQSHRLVTTMSESDVFAKNEITIGEWALLNDFPASGGHITLKKLIQTSGLSRQRVQVLLAGLERAGAVETKPQEQDKRARRVAVTDPGRALNAKVRAELTALQSDLTDDAKLRVLARATRVVRGILKALVAAKAEVS